MALLARFKRPGGDTSQSSTFMSSRRKVHRELAKDVVVVDIVMAYL